jgi:hypothetical protein
MRHGSRSFFIAVLFMLSCVTSGAAWAGSIETLLMPGKVSSAHVKQEAECSNCHDRSDRTRQASLCLACHKDVAADVQARRGMHGRLPNITTAQCSACHSDHHGRDADIVKLDRAGFDHEQTDFALHGAHGTVACESCHAKGKKYREAPATCFACHQKAEPHAGKLGKECGNCHNEASWLAVKFDHDKTNFPLRDAHVQVNCQSCHFGNRYKGTPTQCDSCHAPDDVHRGSRGPDCGKCHTTQKWDAAKFDHEKETHFALLGAHREITCQACHKTGRMEDKIPKTCDGCHRADDHHAGRLGDDCGKCHGNDKWRDSMFDHTRDTRYPLVGKHEKVECHVCHTALVSGQKLPHDCHSCHRAQDVHAGSLGTECEQCHQPSGWRGDTGFDHDLTDFPLVGLHVAVPCDGCHATRAYREAPKNCFGCHQADDVHKGGLGQECQKCHSFNGWGIWQFDHAKETGFALSGAHQPLKCAECHRRPAGEVKLSSDCVSCHQQDDVHAGQFGRQCGRCHTTLTFRGGRAR